MDPDFVLFIDSNKPIQKVSEIFFKTYYRIIPILSINTLKQDKTPLVCVVACWGSVKNKM